MPSSSWSDHGWKAGPTARCAMATRIVPRNRFLSWDQAREMAASGLAEFGSHSYDLHRGIRGNPQGSSPPAAATWAYDPKTDRYETDAALQARVLADLQAFGRIDAPRSGPRAARRWPGRSAAPPGPPWRRRGRQVSPMSWAWRQSRPIPPVRWPSSAFIQLAIQLSATITLLRVDFGRTDPEQRRIVCVSLDRDRRAAREAETMPRLAAPSKISRRLGPSMVVLDTVCCRQSRASPSRRPGSRAASCRPKPISWASRRGKSVRAPAWRSVLHIDIACRRSQCRTRPCRRTGARDCPRRARRWHRASIRPGHFWRAGSDAHIVPALERPGRARPDHRRGRGRQPAQIVSRSRPGTARRRSVPTCGWALWRPAACPAHGPRPAPMWCF